MLLAYGNYRKAGMKVVLYECLIVIAFMRPVVDARRVIKGEENEHALTDAKAEFAANKIFEMACESIPSTVLQSYAFIKSDTRSSSAAFSIMISGLCTGFASSTISFDSDCDPVSRVKNNDFYGYIPDEGRFLVFMLMLLISAFHSFMRSISFALIMTLRDSYLWYYLLGGMTLFFVYKRARGDLRYFRNVDGALGAMTTFLCCAVFKTVTDFTAIIHFRHTSDLGGAYFTANLFINQALCFVAVSFYNRHYNGNNAIDGESLLNGMICASILFFLTFALFIYKIVPKYRKSFFTTMTGKEYACQTFHEAKTDEAKFLIFKKHRSYYKSIEEELRAWLLENYDRWEEEKPSWFVHKLTKNVPDDMLPERVLKDIGGVKGRKLSIAALDALDKVEDDKRKASVFDALKKPAVVVPEG